MEHKGNWSPPIADEGYILVPSNEGFINKEQVLRLIAEYPNNDYTHYLQSILDN